MTFQELIKQGIPEKFPIHEKYDTSISHAPKRKNVLIKQEKILTDNEISLLFNLIDITKPGMPKLNKNKKK